MSSVYATEIASDKIISDNPIHQRLLKAYILSSDQVYGNLLEVGCGEGRGIDWLLPKVGSYYAIDKIEPVIALLKEKYPKIQFLSGNIPPLKEYETDYFDCVVSFQVIEHIQDDKGYLSEISRVLKPGGKAFITTPNRPMSLSRNPWHIREYTGQELTSLASSYFSKVKMAGITGNEKVLEYYEQNRKSVTKLMRWDILDLQHKLPASLLRIPYEMMNRLNRKRLQSAPDSFASQIVHEDYLYTEDYENVLDLFLIAEK